MADLVDRHAEQLRRARQFKGVTAVRMTHTGQLVCKVRVAGVLVEVRAANAEELAAAVAKARRR